MPAVLLRLFSTQDSSIINQEERGEELKKTLGISGKSALSVTELEKQLLQPASTQESTKTVLNNENLPKPVPISIQVVLLSFSFEILLNNSLQKQVQAPPPSISSRVMANSHSVNVNSNLFSGVNDLFDTIKKKLSFHFDLL